MIVYDLNKFSGIIKKFIKFQQFCDIFDIFIISFAVKISMELQYIYIYCNSWTLISANRN